VYGKGTDKAKAERERALRGLTEECEEKISVLRQSLDDCVGSLVKVCVLCVVCRVLCVVCGVVSRC
jgi:hypothetical protein